MTQETQPSTTTPLSTEAQQATNTQLPPLDSSTTPTPEVHKAETPNPFAVPFTIYQKNLSTAKLQSVRWLWQQRLPLTGITLLDGDHDSGKSLLALQLAAHVSSGTRMLDDTTTIYGGVVIISPHTDANTTQIPLLTALGADLSRVEMLSYIQEPETSSHPGGYRPFCLPHDFSRLFEAIDRINARLIILDPFINLLSHDQRWTDQRLHHLLADLNQHLIARNIACLLIRNCPAFGGHARPSLLERSERFLTIAVSRLLLSPDPLQPDHLLLGHALSRHVALAPTLTLQIQPVPGRPDFPSITLLGTHSLQAKELLTHRPDALHRRLLSHHLLELIAKVTDPIPVSKLYDRCPHSSPFQVQRSLNDLINMGQIERPTRGFYAPAPANPIFRRKGTADTPLTPAEEEARLEQRAIEAVEKIKEEQRAKAQAKAAPIPSNKQGISPSMLHFWRVFYADEELQQLIAAERANELDRTDATNLDSEPADELDRIDAITPDSKPAKELNVSAAITPDSKPAKELNVSAAITPNSKPAKELNASAAITPNPGLTGFPNTIDTTTPYKTETTSALNLKFIVMTPEQLREKALREASLDNHS